MAAATTASMGGPAPPSSAGSHSHGHGHTGHGGRPALTTAATTSVLERTGTQSSVYSRAGAGHAARPSTGERAMSSMAVNMASNGVPVASTSIANRTADAAYGLYQNCIVLRRQLRRVPGFAEAYLDVANNDSPFKNSSDSLQSPLSPTHNGALDPVTAVTNCLRLGSPLCFLFNALGDDGPPLDVNPDASPQNTKACQKCAAHFIMACNKRLGWSYDEMFTTTELLSHSTNGTVKVISTVSRFLSLLDERGRLLPEEPEHQDAATDQNLDTRGKRAKEILDTERKYVQDIEHLQAYKRKLSEDAILPQDTIHYLFLNLDEIVDFARKFLVLVEQTYHQPPEQQRFGSLFINNEESFHVYEKYCAHFTSASELADNLSRQENSPLAKLSYMLDPLVELKMFHIKPMQRITRYPLLCEQLVKNTPTDWAHYAELQEGQAATERVVARVNEAIRKEENRQAVEELRSRVEDWSAFWKTIYPKRRINLRLIPEGHELASFGELIMQDTFWVLKADVEREYQVFLFQKILLCCKETNTGAKPKMNKSNSMIRKSAGGSTTPGGQKPKTSPVQLKGRIFINNVIHALPITKSNAFLLQVTWRGDGDTQEAFSIKCRTSDGLQKWHKAVNKAIEDAQANRRSRNAGSLSARRLASPHSQFPNTPQSELGPMPTPSYLSESGLHYTASSASLASSNPYGGTFEDEGDEGYSGDYEPSTGRSTPSLSGPSASRRGPGTQSLPPGARSDREPGRPRAQTEDMNSATITQWRSQTPTDGFPAVPSLPRQSSGSSAGGDPHSLRHSASRAALRHKQSHEWGNPGPMPPSTGSSSGTTVVSRSLNRQLDDMTMANEPVRMLRQNSQGSVPVPPYTAPPPMRSRSASSPNVYQLTPTQAAAMPHDNQWNPYPVQNVHPAHFAAPLKRNPANASSGTVHSTGSATTNPPKRLSSSSTGTDRSSGDSSQSQGLPYASPVSPGTHPTNGHSAPSRLYQQRGQSLSGGDEHIKIKVLHLEDTFVIVVKSSITHKDLVDKIVKKIQLCGARQGIDAATLRLKWEDEEGDRINLINNDDVHCAFDWLRTIGGGQNATLIIHAT